MKTWSRLFAVTAFLAVDLTGAGGHAGAALSKGELKQARSVLIRRSDLPPGWTTSKSNNSNSNTGNAKLAKCLGVPVSVLNYNPPSVNSPEFDDKSAGLSINDSVAVFPNKKIMRAQYRAETSNKALTCGAKMFNSAQFKKQLEKSAGSGATIGHISVTRISPAPGPDKSFAALVTFPIAVSGKKISMTVLTVIIASKLRAVSLTFMSTFGVGFPSSIITQLEVISTQRLG